MVESINKNSQGVLLQSLLTSEIVHAQPVSQMAQPMSTNTVTTCLDGRCGTLSLPVVARALGSMTNNMPFIFIPSVSGSKSTVSLVRSSTLTAPAVSQTKLPSTNASEMAIESLTIVPNASITSSQPSMQGIDAESVSPASGDTRPAAMPLIRPSPATGACKTSFLPILPRYRTRGRSKPRNPSEAQRARSPPPTEEEVREKVMAILGRMKEIEEKQRREKEEAIVSRVGNIKRAARATRSAKRSESPNSRQLTADLHANAKSQRLDSLSPASSAGETTASTQFVDIVRTEAALKPEECTTPNDSPTQATKLLDRTPSPGLDFGSGPLDPFLLQSNKSVENQQSRSASSMGSSGPLVRRCTCSRTGCLKLYCDCFAAGLRCSDCCCVGCRNNSKHEELRQQAIDRIVTRKPDAFLSKIEYSSENESVHTRGCNCKRSACLKNYCECYEARIRCTSRCRCQSCFNTENWNGQNASAPPANQSKLNSPLQVASKSGSGSAVSSTTTTATTTGSCENSATPMLSATHEDLDPLSAMLVDRSGSPKSSTFQERYLAEDRMPAGLVERRPDDDIIIVLDGDSSNFAPADSPSTSRSPSPPASSNSSVMPNPMAEIHGSVVTTTSSNSSSSTGGSTITPTCTVASITGLGTEPQQPLAPLDRVWHVLSQAAAPQLAQPQSVVLPDPLARLHVTANTMAAANPVPAPSVAPQLSVPPTHSPATLLGGGFPADSTNLLATWLVALLSGQSQIACPTQQAPTYFNSVTIASCSPSAILLNCPTIPASVAVTTSPTTLMTTTTTTTTSTVPTDHVAPSPLPRSAPDCFKSDVSPLVVTCPTTNSVDTSRLNDGGDDQYTAEELATFERLIQQRHRSTATAPVNATPVEEKSPPIKMEPLEQITNKSSTIHPTNTERPKKLRYSPVHRLSAEVLYLRRQVLRLTRTIRSQDRSIRALQRTIRQLWMSDSALGR